jgi:hypothetical protein
MHKALFWVAVAVLQLDEVNLYSAGTALLEQNLHTLDTLRVFNDKVASRSTYTTMCNSNKPLQAYPRMYQYMQTTEQAGWLISGNLTLHWRGR